MSKDKTSPVDLVYIIDRSGSMAALISDAVGDNEYDVLFDRVALATVPKLKVQQVQPRGTTALLDAVGKAIAKFQPDWRVVFTVMTDGFENSSKEFTNATLKQLIEARTQGGWEFHFAGAGVDNFAQATSMGFSADKITQTSADLKGTQEYTANFTDAARSYRA